MWNRPIFPGVFKFKKHLQKKKIVEVVLPQFDGRRQDLWFISANRCVADGAYLESYWNYHLAWTEKEKADKTRYFPGGGGVTTTSTSATEFLLHTS